MKILNGNAIKVLAAALMLVDHIGFMWGIIPLSCIGRLSMPMFAFMIAEGCRYTKNKTLHFALIFVLAVVCQAAYAIVSPHYYYLSILVTFSISILLIYALQYFKKCLFDENVKTFEKISAGLLFAAAVFATYALNAIRWAL